MKRDYSGELAALDEQLSKLKNLRTRWADSEQLSPEEKIRQTVTLQLLDGAIQDLQRRRKSLTKASAAASKESDEN